VSGYELFNAPRTRLFFRNIYRVFDGCFTAIDNEQVKSLVLKGNRPPLDAITGPAALVSFATRWIPRCWHKSPEKRPSFHGKHLSSHTLDWHCFRNYQWFTEK